MSSDLIPENVAARSFSHSLRGYDPREVRAYLEEVAEQLRRLQTQYMAARQQLGSIEDHELEALIDSATADINEVLHAARIASQQLTDRASREAADMRTRAEDDAAGTRRRADDDAYALRQSAWDTSSDMLEQVRQEVARLRKQADRDALSIVGEAERNAHKKLATAKRDAEGKLRAARLESERILVEARAERDEMIAHAERASEAAQERTRALERRREELMAELEELRLQREAPPEQPGRGAAETVRVVHTGDPAPVAEPEDIPDLPEADWIDEDDVKVVPAPVQHAPWADGSDTVRLVESPVAETDDFEVDAEEVAGEVARMRAGDQAAPPDADPPAADPPPADPPASDPEPDIAEEPSAERNLAKAWSATDTSPVETSDDLGSLFRELRVEPVETDLAAAAAPPAPAAAHDVPSVEEVTEETPVEALLPVEVVSPFDLRDRALLPITNRALRDVKRQLADVQNLQLEELKEDPANWQPKRDDLDSRLVQELTLLQRESFSAGHVASGEVLGEPASPRVEAPEGEIDPFISALFDEVVLTVQAGREAGHGARELGSAVSKVYRVWRTSEAERRMRHLAGLAYHNGLLRGYGDAGVEDVRIEVDGSCDACGERAEMGLAVGDVGVVPVHDECRCTIVPA